MQRIALVVQRCHPSIVGGSEALCLQYAQMLQDRFQVDVITTTALDYSTWDNALPAGPEQLEDFTIRRFPVAAPRGRKWHRLNRLFRLRERLRRLLPGSGSWFPGFSLARQEEWIRSQGPWSPQLIDFLQQEQERYALLIFMTYLYPTTYFGCRGIPAEKLILVPTLHDEPPAHMSAFRAMAARFGYQLWNAAGEQALVERLWGASRGEIVSMAIDTAPAGATATDEPYLLYCGRIDHAKGCNELLRHFIRYYTDCRLPRKPRLILTGRSYLKIPDHPGISYLGYVEAEEKFRLMAGASLFVMPSPFESLSIVTLEAMGQGTPALVNGNSPVLVGHVEGSGSGFRYENYIQFTEAVERSLQISGQERRVMGERARQYVLSNYSYEAVRSRLIKALEARQ